MLFSISFIQIFLEKVETDSRLYHIKDLSTKYLQILPKKN